MILGRGGVFVLAERGDVLHVRLDGPLQARVRQAIRLEGVDEATAAARLRDVDRARAEYLRIFYPGRRWADAAHHHVVLDSTALALDTCAALIVEAARARLGVPPGQ